MDNVTSTSQVPSSGGSNAEDFQPTTQNPQSVQGNLQQPGATGQSTSGQDILTNQNARIIVPTGNPAPAPTSAAQETSMNWWPVFGMVLLTGLFIWGFIYIMLRRTRSPGIAGTETGPIPEEPKPVMIEVKADDLRALIAPKKAKPKKSKSKRKRSRK